MKLDKLENFDWVDFPGDFKFGSATAAYQIEGGHDAQGKGPSIWDIFTHKKGKIKDNTTGDIACDTYHDFQTDIDFMKEMGLNAYRFSTSWSRVFPEGEGRVNEAGLDYYERLVDALLKADIDPFITLFHWDTPQALYKKWGGFKSRKTSYAFADYAQTMVKRLGDRVKNWITLNEPWEHAFNGHMEGHHAPGEKNPWAYFKVAHHELLGHGLAVQKIRAFDSSLKVGPTLSRFPSYPWRKDNPQDIEDAEFARLFMNGFFMDGIFKGEYPEKLWKRAGLLKPPIIEGDMEIISQKVDFLGINYYRPTWTYHNWKIPLFKCWVEGLPPDWFNDPVLERQGWSQGVYDLCMEAKNDYGNPPIYITESGTGGYPEPLEEDGRVHDRYRELYLQQYLKDLQRAGKNGADIRGYFVWTLMDNFEWAQGFTHPMGLLHMDLKTRKRYIKDSGLYMKGLIEANKKEKEKK